MVETNNADAGDSLDALRAAVQYAVWQACSCPIKAVSYADETSHDIVHTEENIAATTTMTPEALASLSELTYQYATSLLAVDLDCFSTHAGRRSITPADVLLSVRKHANVQRNVHDKVKATMGQATCTLKGSGTVIREAYAAYQGALPFTVTHRSSRTDRRDSSGSSTSSDAGFGVTKPKQQPTSMPNQAVRHWNDSSASSSSDDDIRRRISKKVKAFPKSARGNSKQDDAYSVKPCITNDLASRSRFRLPSSGLGSASQSKTQWDLCGSDESDDECADRKGQVPTQSRVETIVANLSLDSLPSDHEDNLS